MQLNSKLPSGPIETAWDRRKFEMKLVNPANKRKYSIIVVGSGLAGGAASASLAELGYNVKCFCFQDSPRRAHSIAAQGGINAAKNYQNDGDSIYRLFYDTVKGGDFRAREANVYRLAEISVKIIDQCVAQGVPFAREYGGPLANRSFGGAQVSRTFYARGQTGQQLLLGAYQALERQIGTGQVKMFPRTEMLDLIVIDGRARGIVTRNVITGKTESHLADAVVLGTGGYGNAYYLSTNAKGSNATAIWRAHKRGALFANPCFTQIHPTCIPVSGEYQSKLTLMSESLRNDGRVWVPVKKGDKRQPSQIPEAERDYYLERKYPSFGNLVPRDVASRNAKSVCDEGRGVCESGLAVYLASNKFEKVDGSHAAVREAEGNVAAITKRLLDTKGTRSVDSYHRELGKIMWEYCGMARNESGLKKALAEIPALREQYWKDVKVLGTGEELNQSLEKAGRVADFFELAELMCLDALKRNESCGGHFREEYQTPEGEAARDDEHYAYAAAWEFKGVGAEPVLNKESLTFEYVHPSQRSYK